MNDAEEETVSNNSNNVSFAFADAQQDERVPLMKNIEGEVDLSKVEREAMPVIAEDTKPLLHETPFSSLPPGEVIQDDEEMQHHHGQNERRLSVEDVEAIKQFHDLVQHDAPHQERSEELAFELRALEVNE